MICKNCKADLEGNFCSNCGQKSTIKRIDFKYLINEVPNSVLQVNRGFFYTVKQLARRPGYTIRDFFEGKRKCHYKPVAFLIVTTTLYILSTYLLDKNTFIADTILGMEEGATASGHTIDYRLDWIAKNEVYFMLLVLPIFTLASYLAFFRSGYNYFEHLVANFYITGQQMIIYFIFGSIFVEDNVFLAVPLLLGIIYNFWSFRQLFDKNKTYVTIGLILLTYIIFLFLIVLVTATTAKFFT